MHSESGAKGPVSICKVIKVTFVCRKMVHMFTTGDGLLVVKDSPTPDGLQKTFATNVFGHYVLVSQITPTS